MRITILVSGLPPHYVGGTETQTDNMMRHLSKRGHEVTVVSRSVGDAPKKEKRYGVLIKRVRCLNLPALRLASHVISSLWALKGLRKDTDVLQCMMIRPNGFIGALAKKLFGYRYVTWLRSEYKYFGRASGIPAWMAKYALRNSDLILTQSPIIRDEVLEDFPKKKVIAIPNGIDLPKIRAKGNKIVFVGNLTVRKGVEYLLMALHQLKAEGIRLPEAILVGDGPERPKLEKVAKGLKVRFVGRKMPNEVKEYLKDGMIFVLPSRIGRGEGMPNVILEAMSMGLPVISTRIAGIPDMIKPGYTGFLAKPSNSEELAKYLRELITDVRLRKRMSENCLKEIKKYEWEAVMPQLERIYEKNILKV